VGMDPHAMAVQLDEKHAAKLIDLNLVDAKATAEGIKSILIPDNAAVVTCKTANIFLPAPWLKNTILNSNTDCPFELILSACQAKNEFIQDHCGGDQHLQDEIKAHYDGFVSWAWAGGHEKIEPLRFLVRPDDVELRPTF